MPFPARRSRRRGPRPRPVKLDFAALKKDTEIACLYHCDFGDPARFGQMLTNMNNHLSVYEFDDMKVKLVIVTHGAGVKFFIDDLAGTPWANDKIDPELYKRFTGLSKFGVEAYLCEITFKQEQHRPRQGQEGLVPEVRAVRRRHRRRAAKQGLRLLKVG